MLKPAGVGKNDRLMLGKKEGVIKLRREVGPAQPGQVAEIVRLRHQKRRNAVPSHRLAGLFRPFLGVHAAHVDRLYPVQSANSKS